MTLKEIYINNKYLLEKKREYLNSYTKIKNTHQFPKLTKLIKNSFLKLKINNTSEPNSMKSIKNDPDNYRSTLNSDEDFGEHKLEEKSFETLKNYISKLNRMQNEKE